MKLFAKRPPVTFTVYTDAFEILSAYLVLHCQQINGIKYDELTQVVGCDSIGSRERRARLLHWIWSSGLDWLNRILSSWTDFCKRCRLWCNDPQSNLANTGAWWIEKTFWRKEPCSPHPIDKENHGLGWVYMLQCVFPFQKSWCSC